MPPIHQLTDDVINKIAAGEVIERPASVVKELLENALDAGATHVEIDLKEGGRTQIVIRDDGCGIPPKDMKLALMRHATSKLSTASDLSHIATLGFRGEALASIASVSKLSIASRSRESGEPGYEINMEGGVLVSEGETGHPLGTTITVRQLFFQTPARLKFLKSPATEIGHIVDHVIRIALANPQVSIRLNHNDHKDLAVRGTTNLRQRVEDIYGHDVSKSCYPIIESDGWVQKALDQSQAPQIKISGLVGHPEISRSHQRHLFIFVNGRPVRDKVIFHAVMEAYRNLLMHGRYPFVVLNISIPPADVDVNVHPAKSEVRFSNSQAVHRVVQEALRSTLEAEPWKTVIARSLPEADDEAIQNLQTPEKSGLEASETLNRGLPVSAPRYGERGLQDTQRHIGEIIYGSRSEVSYSSPEPKAVHQNTVPFGKMRLLGQLWATYLICEADGKLVLVDQHAAHERIGFEKLKAQWDAGKIATQDLLIPINFDLKPSEAEILKNYLEEFKSFGLEIEFFGGTSFVVRSMPVLFAGKISVENLMNDFVGDILEKGQMTSLKDRVGDILASMACHGAIRANHRLTPQEMQALLKELDDYPFTSYCPHGRPVAVDVHQMELEKWFKRVL